MFEHFDRYFNHDGVSYTINGSFALAISHFDTARAQMHQLEMNNVNNLEQVASEKYFDDGTIISCQVVHGIKQTIISAPPSGQHVTVEKGVKKETIEIPQEYERVVPIILVTDQYSTAIGFVVCMSGTFEGPYQFFPNPEDYPYESLYSEWCDVDLDETLEDMTKLGELMMSESDAPVELFYLRPTGEIDYPDQWVGNGSEWPDDTPVLAGRNPKFLRSSAESPAVPPCAFNYGWWNSSRIYTYLADGTKSYDVEMNGTMLDFPKYDFTQKTNSQSEKFNRYWWPVPHWDSTSEGGPSCDSHYYDSELVEWVCDPECFQSQNEWRKQFVMDRAWANISVLHTSWASGSDYWHEEMPDLTTGTLAAEPGESDRYAATYTKNKTTSTSIISYSENWPDPNEASYTLLENPWGTTVNDNGSNVTTTIKPFRFNVDTVEHIVPGWLENDTSGYTVAQHGLNYYNTRTVNGEQIRSKGAVTGIASVQIRDGSNEAYKRIYMYVGPNSEHEAMSVEFNNDGSTFTHPFDGIVGMPDSIKAEARYFGEVLLGVLKTKLPTVVEEITLQEI